MKRSTQVSLVLMGAVGVGGIAYALSPGCPRPDQGAVAPDQSCSSPRGGGYHGFGSHYGFFSGSSANASTAPASSASPAGATSRGGFGGIGRAFGSSRS
jgi:hypothetical protein